VAVPPASDLGSGVSSDSRARSPRLRLGLLVALVVALVAATGATAYLAATRPVPALGIEGSQEALQSERETVMSQAEQFMKRVNTYGPDLLEGDQMPQYRKLVEEVITPKFAADFEKNVPAAEQTVAQAGLARSAEVFSTGVSAIDSDSATALVAGSFTNSYPSSPGADDRVDTEPSPFRVEVKLLKIKGDWLVDDFTPLTGGSEESPSAVPSVVPSSSPSGEATP
jgi:Mce-associated membrane protein